MSVGVNLYKLHVYFHFRWNTNMLQVSGLGHQQGQQYLGGGQTKDGSLCGGMLLLVINYPHDDKWRVNNNAM